MKLNYFNKINIVINLVMKIKIINIFQIILNKKISKKLNY